MKALVIGGTGDIGKAVVKELKNKKADVIVVGHSSGDIKLDITQPESIQEMYKAVGSVDAIICAPASKIPKKPITKMTKQDYINGIQNKLLGQIDVVLTGIEYLNDNGSFTLTSGVLNRDFIPGGSCIAMVNSALEGFVESASLELPRGLRMNIVSPKLLESSAEKHQSLLIGFETVPDSLVAKNYLKSVYGIINAKIIRMN